MLESALLALRDALSPPFRSVLFKTVGLALLLLVVAGVLLQALAAKLITLNNASLDLFASVLTGLGIVVALVFLVGPVVSLVAGFFLDDIAETVEKTHYPGDTPGRALPIGRSIWLAVKFAVLVLAVNLCALLLLFVPGVNLIVWWVANGYLLGREYFELAAMRFHAQDDVRALRRSEGPRLFLGGLLIAAFLAIPIVNLATPLVATAFMVHLHKRLARGRTLEAG